MEHSFLDEVRQISDSARNKTKVLKNHKIFACPFTLEVFSATMRDRMIHREVYQ